MIKLIQSMVCILLMMAGCVEGDRLDQSLQPEDPENITHVDLIDDVNVTEVANMTVRNGISPNDIIELRFEVGDISGGFTPDQNSPTPLAEQFAYAVSRHFGELAEGAENMPDETIRMLGHTQRQAEQLAKGSALGISQITLRGTHSNLTEDPSVARAESMIVPKHQDREVVQDPQYRSYWHESWAPYYVYSNVTDTLAYQYLAFNNVAAFGTNQAYEAEWQIYEPDMSYGSSVWSSTLPDTYRDSTFLDRTNGVVSFAVGTGSPEQMLNYITYYVAVTLYVDPAQRDIDIWVNIKGQKGGFTYTWCEGLTYTYWWCVARDRVWTGRIDGYWLGEQSYSSTFY